MLYSAFQALFALCHLHNIILDIQTIPHQGFVFTLTPKLPPPGLPPHPLFADIKPTNHIWAGNGHNEFYTYATQFNDPEDPSVCTAVTAQTGILTIELVCRELLDIILPPRPLCRSSDIPLPDPAEACNYLKSNTCDDEFIVEYLNHEPNAATTAMDEMNDLFLSHMIQYVQRTPLDSIREEHSSLPRSSAMRLPD